MLWKNLSSPNGSQTYIQYYTVHQYDHLCMYVSLILYPLSYIRA